MTKQEQSQIIGDLVQRLDGLNKEVVCIRSKIKDYIESLELAQVRLNTMLSSLEDAEIVEIDVYPSYEELKALQQECITCRTKQLEIKQQLRNYGLDVT